MEGGEKQMAKKGGRKLGGIKKGGKKGGVIMS
jgi:hypothetical protein